jgi:rubrerythrin
VDEVPWIGTDTHQSDLVGCAEARIVSAHPPTRDREKGHQMDIYAFAMQMEQDGEQFYRKLATQSGNEGMRRILTMLAEDEVKHYRIVKAMADRSDAEMVSTTVLADARNVFAGLQGADFSLEGEQIELYREAQEIELKSQAFYEEKAGEVDDPAAKNLLLKIADEEKRHYFLLDNMVEFINRPYTWIENAEFNHLEDY